jgi:hypothetical protein
MPTQHGMPLPHIPQQPQSEFSTTRPASSIPAQVNEASPAPHTDPRSTRIGHDAEPSAVPGPHEVRRSLPPSLPRKRPLRPGQQTMILSKRRSGRKDWLFVALVVGALGVTASMLFAYQNHSESDGAENAEGAGAEEEQESAQEAPDDTAMQAASAEPEQPASAGSVRATELRSDPVGAEVVVNGAVVGNTPVRVARAGSDVDYTLRLPGYESKVVRVGSQSPATISVTLRANTP